MKYSKYIWTFLITLLITAGVKAQYVNIVCAGDSGVVYRVKGNPGSTFIWNVQGGSITDDYGDSIHVNWGMIPGEYELRVQEVSRHGCAAVPVRGMVLVSSPILDLGDNRDVCEGEMIEIIPAGEYYSYLWQDGSVTPNYIVRNQGTISLTVSDRYGCTVSDDIQVSYHPNPIINLGRDTTLCGNESLTLDAGNSGLDYKWSTGQTTREITVFEGQQLIIATVTDDFGCIGTDSIVINSCSTTDIFKDMPSGFTPNGDGKNDVWIIPQLELFPQAVVEVFNRWGILVFRSEPGYTNPWDGNSGGKEMPMDSYYFVITLNSAGLEPVTGTVTLIR